MKSAASTTAADALDEKKPSARVSALRRPAIQPARHDGGAQANPLASVIGYRLRRAQLATFQEFIDYFSRVKLRPAEYALIAVLNQNPGLSQTGAASMLGIKRANFVSLLDSMERRGLAERRAVHGDRRSRAIHLTQTGYALAAKANLMADAYENMLIERLGGLKERDRFLHMLECLIAKTPNDKQ